MTGSNIGWLAGAGSRLLLEGGRRRQRQLRRASAAGGRRTPCRTCAPGAPRSRTRGTASLPSLGDPTACGRCGRGRDRRHRLYVDDRSVRTVADGRPARRQPAHGADRLAVRPVGGGAASCCAWRISTASGGAGARARPTRRPRGARPRLGRCRRGVRASASRVYDEALAELGRRGLTYECFCSRREIREAAAAPHGDDGLVYPGTCRELTDRRARRAGAAERPPAAALPQPTATPIAFDDIVAGAARGRCRTTSCCAATTACPPTTWRSSSTTPPRASTSRARRRPAAVDPRARSPSQRALGLAEPRVRPRAAGRRRRRATPRQARRRDHARRAGRPRRRPSTTVRSALAASLGVAEPRRGRRPRRPRRALRPGDVRRLRSPARSPLETLDLAASSRRVPASGDVRW